MQPDWTGERVVGYADTLPPPKTKKSYQKPMPVEISLFLLFWLS